MNNLFIYSIALLLSINSIWFFAHYIHKKKIILRDILFACAGALFIGITTTTVIKGVDIYQRLSVEFNVPKDLYSEAESDSINNPVNEKIFYNHLLLMRAPHAKVMYAQAVHESNHFKSQKFKLLRNCFGMKTSYSRVTTSDNSKGEFKKYKDWQESTYDYIFWVFSRNLDKLSDSEYLEYIGKIYAEDGQYKQKIQNIIKTTDFEKLEK